VVGSLVDMEVCTVGGMLDELVGVCELLSA
jgi:hypothetical protein